ncbi:MAG: hypothetical protein P1V97_36315 [Planctomycetota bacterium]|nr:hypothetical protein [Planctomycetota bacterium]
MNTNMSSEEINAILQAYASRPTVELVKPLEIWSDQDLEEEAEKRQLSWLSIEPDEELLEEVESRGLLTVKSDMSEDEFEREAAKRGFRSSLAQWSIEDIQSYLKLQGHNNSNSHGNHGNSSRGGGGNRRNYNKKRKNNNNRRNHSSHN